MPDPDVQRWRQSGAIAMWRNRRGRREWNIAASATACDRLLDLFELMEVMEVSRWSSKKELRLTTPIQTPDHGGDISFQSARRLTIKYSKDRVSDDHWQISEDDRKLQLEVGLKKLQELRNAIEDMKQGGGDYSIGNDENPLWIWWWINNFIVPGSER